MRHLRSTEGLRFGAYRRVSTEEQRDRGNSLDTQRTRIKGAVDDLGGQIVEWYGGAEHATPDHTRAEFERLKADAEGGRINAICVADGTRWSRDIVAHEQAVRILKRHRVRLFFGPVEQDLRNAAVQVGMTLNAKSSEMETGTRLDASVSGRIEKAALGFATSGGDLPYGRHIEAKLHGTRRAWAANPDGTAKWDVDQDKKRYVVKAVRLYLSGKTWGEVAQDLGQDENTLRRRVLAAGGVWQQRFRLRDGQRPEEFAAIKYFERLSFDGDLVTVTIPIPALLDDVTLARVRAKAAAHHADYKARNKQALGGYLQCACGGSVGTHFQEKTRAVYLQHSGRRLPGCPASFGRYEPLERSVFRRLSSVFNDPVELEAAVKESLLAETTRQPELEQQRQDAKAEYAALKREHDSLYEKLQALNLVEGGAMISRFTADEKRLEGQLKSKEDEIKRLDQELKVTRLPADFSARVEFTLFCLRGFGTNTRWLWMWPKAKRRALCEFLLGRPTRKPPEGSARAASARAGIYLERKIDDETGKPMIEWTAHGWFPQVSDKVWLDPKVASCFRPSAKGGGIDRKRLVQLIRRLDVGQFRLAFNAEKLAGTRARS